MHRSLAQSAMLAQRVTPTCAHLRHYSNKSAIDAVAGISQRLARAAVSNKQPDTVQALAPIALSKMLKVQCTPVQCGGARAVLEAGLQWLWHDVDRCADCPVIPLDWLKHSMRAVWCRLARHAAQAVCLWPTLCGSG